jgi:hypothetical protein
MKALFRGSGNRKFRKVTDTFCTLFLYHQEPYFQDRKNGKAPGKTMIGFAGRKKVHRISL